MLAVEYGTMGKYACSTMSSETISESCGSRNNRIRTVRLVRPPNGPLPPLGLTYRHGPSLGFSIRGGREHGTGIFVSHVELGSEAHIQGLRVGDQIIRVNGFAVDDAVHKEVLQLISNHTHVTLKVRGVGMIPVKDKKSDGLSWQIITDIGSPSRGSPQLGDKLNDVRISIMVAPKSKLGCGICKGPDWKPGIFVQFTKEGGIAREAGLQPGDQLLYCNNVDFSDIPFNEAVSLMKSSRQLNLIVRKGAGSELFPGESSGYNSSASSVTGDQSPSWSESKRLSIVKEESLELGERLHHLDKMKNLNKWESWDDVEHEDKPLFKPTIINLSENGTTIQNNGDVPVQDEYQTPFNLYNIAEQNGNNEEESEEVYAPKPEVTRTVVVEVHETKPKLENSHLPLAKSSSTSSFCSLASKSSCASSVTSNVTNTSLSSAITLEIQRRQKSLLPQKCSIDEQIQKKKILKNIDEGRQNQHSKLMDEFKKAHQKMFKNGDANQEERLNNLNKNQELSEKLSERLTDLQNSITEDVKKLTLSKPSTGTVPPPPPPPPQETQPDSLRSTPSSSTPSTRSNTLKLNKPKQAPPVPVKYSSLSYMTLQQNGSQKATKPPPCPTPDYDTVSLASTASAPASAQNDQVEMESLESFKINNPSEVQPRPPSTYFQKRTQTNGCGTVRRSRPVSITIGEYPTMRRQPGKLDFLQNGQNGAEPGRNLGDRLASELTQTLNRSNLKKRTESMENLLCDHVSNLSKKSFAKSTSDLTECNRVTISVTKPEPPNGILKNCSTNKTLLAQKSITFGEMPTIKDKPPAKT